MLTGLMSFVAYAENPADRIDLCFWKLQIPLDSNIVRTWMNGAVACIDNTPASLGTHFAHGGTRVWHLIACPERVGRAVEAIGCCNRPDFDGFKQDVVTGVSTHAACFSIVFLALCSQIPNVSL
jgi:hypothetical protein